MVKKKRNDGHKAYQQRKEKSSLSRSSKEKRKKPNVKKEREDSKSQYKFNLNKEKQDWIFIALAILFIAISFLDIFSIPSNNRFDPNPISIGDIGVKLNCISKNTEFITEDSSISCNTSLISRSNIKFTTAYISIQAFNSENISNAIWECSSTYNNIIIDNASYTIQIPCENTFFGNVFQPEKSGKYVFKINNLEARDNLYGTGRGVSSGFNIDRPYTGDMTVITNNEATNISLADKSYKIAIIALLLYVPTLVLEIRRFLKDK